MSQNSGTSPTPTDPGSTGTTQAPSAEAVPRRPVSIWVAGLAGIAACLCGMGILLAGCAGEAAALRWSPLPLGLGLAGLLLAVIGSTVARDGTVEGPQILAAIFTSCCGIFGGLVEMAAWLGWRTFR